MSKSHILQLCETIRTRSVVHQLAMTRLDDLPSMMAVILRMELDSMLRVIYILSKTDLSERELLSQQTITGQPWTVLSSKNKKLRLGDKAMAELANQLEGWTCSVYKFGCAFIQFSHYHAYSANNPFDLLAENQKKDLLSHMRHYYQGPKSDAPTFDDFAVYFPKVFSKISDSLDFYLGCLENEELFEHII